MFLSEIIENQVEMPFLTVSVEFLCKMTHH